MNTNNEVKKNIIVSVTMMAYLLIVPTLAASYVYLPYFRYAKGQNVSIYDYTAGYYQLAPSVSIAFLLACVVHALLLFSFIGILQLKETARKALILISFGGIFAYIAIYIVSQFVGQKLSFPAGNCLLLLGLVYVYTRPKVKALFK